MKNKIDELIDAAFDRAIRMVKGEEGEKSQTSRQTKKQVKLKKGDI